MAVVRNLMVRIGADYSGAKKGMQGATRELNRFKSDATKATNTITGKRGLGGISAEFKQLGNTVTSTFSRIRGARGVGGVVSELRNLRPVLGSTTKGLGSLGGAATGMGMSFGSAALRVTALVAVLGVVTVVSYKASQAAVKFEADIGRLNISLNEGSKSYMQWARAQGLAKQSAVELGATYGNLLGSFIKDNKTLQSSTQDLVHATRVISSYTGRDLDDVFNRIRSGMLGSTEAIEDLGVYVNISMIESTQAFRKFAGDKSWSQLTFQQQQQIRLAAILEQTYARYGNSLQNNVMTKQERMMEQFKDVKLHLSQAFLPIWDSVLPALTRFAEALADVTEQLARFTYWIRGWDYDEMNSGTDKQTDSVNELDESLQDTEKSAKKAYKALAAFDEINLIGDSSGDGGSGSGGSGSGGGPGGIPGGTGGSGSGSEYPAYPPMNPNRWRLEFDPPNPPDAGMGAVATAVTTTINTMVAQATAKMAEMWDSIDVKSRAGVLDQQASWDRLSSHLGSTVPATTATVNTQWQNMWGGLNAQTQTGNAVQQSLIQSMLSNLTTQTLTNTATVSTLWSAMWDSLRSKTAEGAANLQTAMSVMFDAIDLKTLATTALTQLEWSTMLDSMMQSLSTFVPDFNLSWDAFKANVSSLKIPLDTTNLVWGSTLASMLEAIMDKRPQFQFEWSLIGLSALSIIPSLNTVKINWGSALADMWSAADTWLSSILSKIASVVSAWNSLKQTLTGGVGGASPAASPAPATAPTGRAQWVDDTPVLGDILKGLDWISDKTSWTKALEPYAMPGAGVGAAMPGVGAAAGGAMKYLDDALKGLSNWLKGAGISVPAMATGGIVRSPTLAMIGEAGAEAVVPLEDTSFVDTLASAIGTAVANAREATQGNGGQNSEREIVLVIDGAVAGRVLFPHIEAEQDRIGVSAIRTL